MLFVYLSPSRPQLITSNHQLVGNERRQCLAYHLTSYIWNAAGTQRKSKRYIGLGRDVITEMGFEDRAEESKDMLGSRNSISKGTEV